MKATATVILVCVLGVAAAACGEQFTLSDGAGGAGGAGSTKASATTTSSASVAVATSSSSSSSSSSGVATSTGAAPPPVTCSAKAPDCGADAYCQVQSCSSDQGICTSLPTVNKGDFDPLCGCDGNTYWSGVEASGHHQAVLIGECTTSANVCGTGVACASGTYCSLEAQSCKLPTADGKCWVLPMDCSAHPEGGQPCAGIATLDGGGQTCASICKMITNSVTWTRTQPPCTP